MIYESSVSLRVVGTRNVGSASRIVNDEERGSMLDETTIIDNHGNLGN